MGRKLLRVHNKAVGEVQGSSAAAATPTATPDGDATRPLKRLRAEPEGETPAVQGKCPPSSPPSLGYA